EAWILDEEPPCLRGLDHHRRVAGVLNAEDFLHHAATGQSDERHEEPDEEPSLHPAGRITHRPVPPVLLQASPRREAPRGTAALPGRCWAGGSGAGRSEPCR